MTGKYSVSIYNSNQFPATDWRIVLCVNRSLDSIGWVEIGLIAWQVTRFQKKQYSIHCHAVVFHKMDITDGKITSSGCMIPELDSES